MNFRNEIADFGAELLQGGVADPWNGIAQLIHAPQVHLDTAQNKESIGGKAGAMLGGITDLALLTLGARGALRETVGAAADSTVGSAASFGLAGAMHGGIFTPSEKSPDLLKSRLEQAGVEEATMSAVGLLNAKLEPVKLGYRVPLSVVGNGAIGAFSAVGSEAVVNHRTADVGTVAKQALLFGALGGGFTMLDGALAKAAAVKPEGDTSSETSRVVPPSDQPVTAPFSTFERLSDQPIVSPKPGTLYSKGAFNPTVVQTGDGAFHMLFRGQDDEGVSRVFYGSSADGKAFEIQDEPVLSPRLPDEAKGIEDPRLSRNPDNHNEWLLTATAFDGRKPQLGIWKSTDLKSWEPITPESAVVMPLVDGVREGQTKSGVILDERINGKQWMYVMRDYPDGKSGDEATHFSDRNSDQTTVASSVDGIHWTEESAEPLLVRRPGMFDERVVEPGPPPIMTDKGILMLYNGGDNSFSYKTGWALFDRNNPARLIARSDEPVIKPELPWEINSNAAGEVDQKGNLIFTQGLIRDDSGYKVYYGGADSFIGVAHTSLNPHQLFDTENT